MRAAVRGVPAGALPDRLRAAWASLPPLYHLWAMSAGGERYLVAERGGRVAGYAAWRGAELTAVFVRPSAAGRGVGAALVAAVERRARNDGFRALRVLAAAPAIGFYARLGFRPGRAARAPLPGGLGLPARWMRKPLATG
ncbi:GCN5-related N-acetyltransferase [Anaeromyxobacter dehalogenans 2CP-1]|uniref:GCN5-related N-acetyltransferase n=1 Tax=Anaeromyxobacter dehalogenans (strain ATCC BAA-258 / DSM 21875 / 2CP-1) TaxID=455488 RepID=B8J7Z0_ANAD2|nr:GNAT family N-acetyltransferase [Anaeromyxobacter dehalogenans]ACL63482.1 GCN5-related N-acetyltransferase [Anaeromyxobacter dehalogenans 2CP-1]